MSIFRNTLILVAFSGLQACTVSHTKTARPADSRVFESGFSEVFDATVKSLDKQGFTFGYVYKKKGVIHTEEKVTNEMQFEAEREQSDKTYKWKGYEYAKVRASIKEVLDEKTRVDLNVFVREVNTATGLEVAKPSNGTLEEELFVAISDKLKE
jgi:hypothetical protein